MGISTSKNIWGNADGEAPPPRSEPGPKGEALNPSPDKTRYVPLKQKKANLKGV